MLASIWQLHVAAAAAYRDGYKRAADYQVAEVTTAATYEMAGLYRTLAQDLSFAVDQLVEIAIRALSAAVNDTFTALTCIDWLGESLCKIAAEWSPTQIHRDQAGEIRLISAAVRPASTIFFSPARRCSFSMTR